MGEQDAVVEVRGLRRRFNAFWAVDGVDLDVHRGEIVGLLGPNGAGKSTSIRMICGLLMPTAGSISVAGVDPVRDPLAVKARIGYMTQHQSLYTDLTVAENLEFYAALYGLRRDDRDAAMRRWMGVLALDEYARRPMGEMPPGWLRRVAFACAVIAEPPVLVLDEPTSGVDLETSDLLWQLCARQARAGAAVLVTTHQMGEAERCGRVCVLAAGKVVGQGTPQELEATLAGRVLGVQAEPLGQALQALKAWPGARAVAVVGQWIRVEVDPSTGSGPSAAADEVRKTIEAAGAIVQAIEPVDPTLDDVFLHLVTAGGAQT